MMMMVVVVVVVVVVLVIICVRKNQKAMTTVKAVFELVLEPYSRPILLIVTT